MDKVKAQELEARLKGKEVAGCMVNSLIDFGKSAAVFRGMRGDEIVAIKIFDDELIERYGDKAQLARIDRELELIGKHHDNMVKILDGGVDENSDNHFIVMEYLNGPSLQNCLQDVAEERIPALIEQLVSCCEFLENMSLAHRDIKPANIVLTNDLSKLVLLDFGVLKPVGQVGVTDDDGIQSFVGTLQYSSPEFLLREEEDNLHGWRALSLYQIGAVLHDLVTRRPIFESFVNPYASLVNAVQLEQPKVSSKTLPSYLIDACNMALVKNPKTRLDLVGWDSFRPPKTVSAGPQALERLKARHALSEAARDTASLDIDADRAELQETVIEGLKVDLRRVRQSYSSHIPPLEILPDETNACSLKVKIVTAAVLKEHLDIQLDITIAVIDVSAQAVSVQVSARVPSTAEKPITQTQIYSGPYEASKIGDRLGDAMLVAVDLCQSGETGTLNLTELGVV